jgi:hypothetical protein
LSFILSHRGHQKDCKNPQLPRAGRAAGNSTSVDKLDLPEPCAGKDFIQMATIKSIVLRYPGLFMEFAIVEIEIGDRDPAARLKQAVKGSGSLFRILRLPQVKQTGF